MSLFNVGEFSLHSGDISRLLIDCNALSDDDLKALAALVVPHLEFGEVHGIPAGGVRFASALKPYITEGPRLVVDDVVTTGASIYEEMRPSEQGVVIFNRSGRPLNRVLSIFTLTSLLLDTSVETLPPPRDGQQLDQ